MAGSSAELHEDPDKLSEATVDRHRAIVSLMEELEAVDWYDQRVEATNDESLAELLAHNRDEEKEHAAMNLEWLRRRDAGFDEQLRTYLFTDRPLLAVEEASDGGDAADTTPDAPSSPAGLSGLGIGGLKGTDSL
ncbi:MAG: ferritin-like domain-containing protein [Candidatus Microthrix subdominans]|uniref:Ferritin n=1 Tax=Candidatus Neomicrothrix subdominans TaxID=2954438 RepID=A0A936NDT6_9ACTN|nr:ferritin-like domain-containing protein [Candidatus Microthrix sp.]MBK9297201.1 ferritin [Candidatus Microthrix subdominans]MBK6309195.1 ferritin [Candidatus Microthrix sp.]MBK6440245.1 ferritin [Candidatus Microthrix sp.]MBK6970379.1 ferritin [Candidatus Microthrix sp.]MBK7163852.1 ferritin [Candidatus Microthrix sp.]